VSTLMRNIDSSPWLTQPELVEIKLVPSPIAKDLRINEFTLNAKIKQLAPPEEPKAPVARPAPAAPAAAPAPPSAAPAAPPPKSKGAKDV
jgi:Tfp pilus assembly protein PilN